MLTATLVFMGNWWENITPFGEILYDKIRKIGLRPAEFARRADISTAYLTNIHKKNSPPPEKHLEKWADILQLTGNDRDFFLDIAAIENASPRILRMMDPSHAARPAINESQSRVAEDPEAYDEDLQRNLRQAVVVRDNEIEQLRRINQELKQRLEQVRQAAQVEMPVVLGGAGGRTRPPRKKREETT